MNSRERRDAKEKKKGLDNATRVRLALPCQHTNTTHILLRRPKKNVPQSPCCRPQRSRLAFLASKPPASCFKPFEPDVASPASLPQRNSVFAAPASLPSSRCCRIAAGSFALSLDRPAPPICFAPSLLLERGEGLQLLDTESKTHTREGRQALWFGLPSLTPPHLRPDWIQSSSQPRSHASIGLLLDHDSFVPACPPACPRTNGEEPWGFCREDRLRRVNQPCGIVERLSVYSPSFSAGLRACAPLPPFVCACEVHVSCLSCRQRACLSSPSRAVWSW